MSSACFDSADCLTDSVALESALPCEELAASLTALLAAFSCPCYFANSSAETQSLGFSICVFKLATLMLAFGQ